MQQYNRHGKKNPGTDKKTNPLKARHSQKWSIC